MSEQSAIAVYDSMSKAEEAVSALERDGFSIDRVSIITQNQESEKEVHRHTGKVVNATMLGATTGIWAGWLFGVLAGAAFIWVPGVGPTLIIGHLASTALLGGIEGAVAGAVGGGVLGTLTGWGISTQHVLKYEEKLKDGKYLVIVHGSAEEVKLAQNILANTNAEELSAYAANDT
ncbi:MAG: 2-oxobutyrate oxidase [Hapalosiphonaceae cyanobacterium JJU2]|nr:MAG: 2-oxobutyrate oxidase [Hapalosiphonaceae cyanobacterium JJU2]